LGSVTLESFLRFFVEKCRETRHSFFPTLRNSHPFFLPFFRGVVGFSTTTAHYLRPSKIATTHGLALQDCLRLDLAPQFYVDISKEKENQDALGIRLPYLTVQSLNLHSAISTLLCPMLKKVKQRKTVIWDKKAGKN